MRAQSEKKSPAKRAAAQRQPQCIRQRSRLIFPPAPSSPAPHFTRFFPGPLPHLPCKSCALKLLRTLFRSLRSFFAFASFVFKRLHALLQKHPGGGVPLRQLCALCDSALSLAVDVPTLCFHTLTNCPLTPIDLQTSLFHALTNCFFRNSFGFTSMQIAGDVTPSLPSMLRPQQLASRLPARNSRSRTRLSTLNCSTTSLPQC
jgi:hypothetical protein